MTKKKRIFLLLILSLLLISAVLLKGLFRREEYNKTPDLSGKKPDTALSHTEYGIPTSIEALTAHADAILIGTVADDTVRNENGQLFTEVLTEKILAGDVPESFLLLQTTIGSSSEPIVRTGERMILILRRQKDHFVTSSDGVFILDDNGCLASLSPFIICARYDGLHLRSFEHDLKESYFYSVIGGSDEERKALAEQYRNDEAFQQKRIDEWNDLTGGKPLDYEYAVIDSFFD